MSRDFVPLRDIDLNQTPLEVELEEVESGPSPAVPRVRISASYSENDAATPDFIEINWEWLTSPPADIITATVAALAEVAAGQPLKWDRDTTNE